MTGILESVDHDLLAPARPDLAALVHWGGAAARPIHRWFRYREGFSPALITELGLGHRILDPFCGSGSIMVGAAQQGRASMGIDVNPLATFVSRVKLAPLSDAEIVASTKFLAGFERAVQRAGPWPVPALRIAPKVFEPRIGDAVLRLRTLLEERAISRAQRDFLLLAWLSILQDVGSYFKEGNGIKYRNRKRRRDGYVARPDGVWQLERFGADQAAFVWAAFQAKLSEMLADVPAWHRGNWRGQRVIAGNALEEAGQLGAGSFDSVLFSPPYANRFDYFESQKVELWFGGFVKGYDDMLALRKRSLRSHLGAALDGPVAVLPEIEALVERMDPASYAMRMRVPALVRGYFSDMAVILRHCRHVLVPGGQCSVVVGNSAYGGVIIPTDQLIARLGLAAGFDAAAVVPVRHLTVAPQQRNGLRGRESLMRESVVVLS
ncbi:MAG: site-specific DNA-methyltransferase [Actinobacteria bacterium]|nr:site-specific DNA-methyltransferase [Actinomycetota bacterium]